MDKTKYWYMDTKCDDKEFLQFKECITKYSFILNYRGVGEEVCVCVGGTEWKGPK